MALKNTDCNQGSCLGSEDAISWANESDKSSFNPLLGQEDTLIGTLWWMECDFEEELSLKIEIDDGSHPSSRYTNENYRATVALLAEWHDIECTLGIIDSVQDEKVSHAGEELGDDVRRASLLSEWYLIEDSLDAEGPLDCIMSRGRIDESLKVKTDYIVNSAIYQINKIVATAKMDLHKSVKSCGTSQVLAIAATPEALIEDDVLWTDLESSVFTQLGLDPGNGISDPAVFQCPSDTDSDAETLTLHLDLSSEDEDQSDNADDSNLYLNLGCDQDQGSHAAINSGISAFRNLHKISAVRLQPTDAKEAVTGVNKIVHEIDSDHFVVASEAMGNIGAGGVEMGKKHLLPSWRWSGIPKVLVHRMPCEPSSGRMQRKDATWRRKHKPGHWNSTELVLVQVQRQQHKVKRKLHYRKIMSLHMLARHTLSALKTQMRGPVRRQKKPLSCWRYSRISTHGILGQQHLRYSRDSGNDLCMGDIAESDTLGNH